jgi:S1-C subfamily serine protease
MIILAGAGHIAHGSGIPRRLQRRLDNARIAILLPADAAGEDMQGADYLLISDPVELAAAAKMGVMLDLQDGVSAREVLPDSAAEHAGMQNDDRILSIAGQPIQSLTDIRLALLDKLPGDAIGVTVQRHSDSGTERLTLQLTLRK